MKLHILSDLHTEFADCTPPPTDADVVVLAGDIGIGLAGIEWAARNFADKPVVYVPGNHEYYDHDLSLIRELKATAPANIQVLDNDTVEINGIRFVGSTLWTDFNLYGEAERFHSMRRSAHLIKDFSSIRNGSRKFTPEDSVRLHENGKAWIQEALGEPFDGPSVVVTHHLPSTMSIAPQYATDPSSPAFASRLEALIEIGRPVLWIHGHTHEAHDYQIFDTRVICNPRGYPGETQGSRFHAGLVVEV